MGKGKPYIRVASLFYDALVGRTHLPLPGILGIEGQWNYEL